MHPNAEFAKRLQAWSTSGLNDDDDVIGDAQKRGFLAVKDGATVLTSKGTDFLAKWTAGKPKDTYQRKPTESMPNETSRSSRPQDRGRNSDRQGGYSTRPGSNSSNSGDSSSPRPFRPSYGSDPAGAQRGRW